MQSLAVRLVGGPTGLLTIGGLRLLTDPTFDEPGAFDRGAGTVLHKVSGPAVPADQTLPVDAVLLSHDHHADNLDDAGMAFLERVPQTLTTLPGATRLGGTAVPMREWDEVVLTRRDVGGLRVTAVPAEHGPPGTRREPPDVIGFLLHGEGLPTVYVSGDNASVDVVDEIVARAGGADVAILFAGAAMVERLPGVPLTLTGERAAQVAQRLGARHVVPLHVEGWTHFSEDASAVRDAFARAGLSDRLTILSPGDEATLS